jgi:signal transduction histidine kinase
MVLDKALMLLVFQNLIENAIKYNDERPRIKIACEDSGKSWLISVSDNGIGIKESDLERIFLFHVRTVKDENGTGVGLSVCRKVVSIHGGRIWAESGKNKGTTFKFLISKSLGPGEKHEKES